MTPAAQTLGSTLTVSPTNEAAETVLRYVRSTRDDYAGLLDRDHQRLVAIERERSVLVDVVKHRQEALERFNQLVADLEAQR